MITTSQPALKINIKPIILINTMCPAKYLHTNVSLMKMV
jgi:hypothetical protein